MTKKPNTNLIVRVQARGGMFLGPDSYGGAVITITDFHTHKVLANGFTDKGGSGTRLAAYNYSVSPEPIITPTTPIPSIYWLSADDDTVKFAASLFLKSPALLKIAARIPLPEEQGDQFVNATQWIIPEKDWTTGAGLVLEIPGLWVQPEIITNGNEVRVRAKVTMMCGCEINANTPWIPTDFQVVINIQSTGKTKNPVDKTIPLTFEENSQFIAEFTLPKGGDFQATILAYQVSTDNSGVAKKGFRL